MLHNNITITLNTLNTSNKRKIKNDDKKINEFILLRNEYPK